MLDYKSVFAAHHLTLSDDQIDKLKVYAELLKKWNQKMNLTAIDDDEGILYRHFLDSLIVLNFIDIGAENKIVDIGTGAGFPGMPLAIVTSADSFLFDALNKRIEFLKAVVDTIQLNNVNLQHGRAEDFGRDSNYRDQFDFAFSRAVTALNVLLEYAIPLLKTNGKLLVYKSLDIQDEISDAKYAFQVLACEISNIYYYTDFYQKKRQIIEIVKLKETSSKYPRRNGIPGKKPLL